ncbi:hypothetical protein CITFRE_35380 [Citrobacter freundii]|nr:hypothetical protein CITFRE_35380 [Citrobacter freundii]
MSGTSAVVLTTAAELLKSRELTNREQVKVMRGSIEIVDYSSCIFIIVRLRNGCWLTLFRG